MTERELRNCFNTTKTNTSPFQEFWCQNSVMIIVGVIYLAALVIGGLIYQLP